MRLVYCFQQTCHAPSRALNLHDLLVFRHDDLRLRHHRTQGFGVGEALRLFAVDADDLFDVAGKFFDVALQFIFVRVAGIGVERNDFRANTVRFAENVHGRFARDDLIAERAFRAVADEQHQILRVAEIVFQVMSDASALAHA